VSGDAPAGKRSLAGADRAALTAICVYKIGGSLLPLPDLPRRIERMIGAYAGCRPLLVVGGGSVVDVVREWDRIHQLGDESAHRLAVVAMSLNAMLVARLLDGARLVNCLDEARAAWEQCEIAVVQPEHWLNRYEPKSATPLSHSWSVTSDSIAAWIAAQVGAERLMLVKSVDRPGGGLRQAARSGRVDAAFPALAMRLPCIEWLNLRREDAKVEHWWPANATLFAS
jgi:aspartokinase-like uncharacterized kinase